MTFNFLSTLLSNPVPHHGLWYSHAAKVHPASKNQSASRRDIKIHAYHWLAAWSSMSLSGHMAAIFAGICLRRENRQGSLRKRTAFSFSGTSSGWIVVHPLLDLLSQWSCHPPPLPAHNMPLLPTYCQQSPLKRLLHVQCHCLEVSGSDTWKCQLAFVLLESILCCQNMSSGSAGWP